MELGLNMTMPRNHGYDVVNSIKAMESSDLEFLFCLGGNFVSASPDSTRTSKAIGNLSMGVHVSTKLNRSHLIQTEENLILPCLGRTELDKQDSGNQFVSVENSMGVVHMSEEH